MEAARLVLKKQLWHLSTKQRQVQPAARRSPPPGHAVKVMTLSEKNVEGKQKSTNQVKKFFF